VWCVNTISLQKGQIRTADESTHPTRNALVCLGTAEGVLACASPVDEDRGRLRLLSRAPRSAAEESDQLVALAFAQSGDRL
jgi:hypothetical protein